jgi:P-type Ca2+ transporter type 2C
LTDFYKGKLTEVYKILKTSEAGITSGDAKERLDEHGYNKIESKKKISPILLFFDQFNDPMVWVLLGAALISAVLGEMVDFYVISIILIINAIIGFIQEYKAEKAIEALKKMASQKAVVIRDGEDTEINADEIVPGDIILLVAGDKVPADARLISINNLQTQEAALTGESLAVKKEINDYNRDLQLGDMKNMVFSGTIVTDGKAKAVVVKTGMHTEIGRIAKLLESTEDEQTPLQKKLETLGKYLTFITMTVCIIVFGVIFAKEHNILNALITAVSLAVAAIPEGLPAVVTISLALGVQRMIKRHALIRRLPSVETLGGTTVICTDKTGTLTKNEMTVKKIYVDGIAIDITGTGYVPEGTFSEHPGDLDLLLKIGLLNNDAKLEKTEEGYFKIRGDPTEGALIVSGEKAGFNSRKLFEECPRTNEVLFDSVRKRMATIHQIGKKRYSYVKGAPDVILGLCDKIIINEKVVALDQKWKNRIIKQNEEFSNDALRVLGFAYKELEHKDTEKDFEKGLVFVGLQGMIDPPREEAKDAIYRCKTAGIKVVMITGDYKGTAVAIARQLGITGRAITGDEIKNMDLSKEVETIGIYARVNPEHKMKIVDALKKKGHIVAMTGDGVNDAPALKASDIGISMSITGTDVAKESADMILTDDNFASIVNAVEEGRGIFDNITKFVQYLLSCNIAEILVIFIATLMNLPLPLFAVQILWMNLVTDGLPAVALGVDPTAKDVMKRKPRNPKEGILTKAFMARVLITGLFITLGTLFVFWYNLYVRQTPEIEARTLAFCTLVLLQFVPLFIIRSEYHLGFFSNKKLLLAVLSSVVLQLAVVYTGLNDFFKTVPLNAIDWLFIAGVWILIFILSKVMNKVLNASGLKSY